LSDITSKFHIVAVFVIVDLQTVLNVLHSLSSSQIWRAWLPGFSVVIRQT